MSSADTLCRVKPPDRTDASGTGFARWMGRGPCFAIVLGKWQADLGTEYVPPPRVRLDSAQESPTRAVPRTQPLRFDSPVGSAWRFGGWSPMRGDSLQLSWSTGFSALTLSLGIAGDSLAGRGIWTYDVLVTDSLGFEDTSGLPQGPAFAHRVACK